MCSTDCIRCVYCDEFPGPETRAARGQARAPRERLPLQGASVFCPSAYFHSSLFTLHSSLFALRSADADAAIDGDDDAVDVGTGARCEVDGNTGHVGGLAYSLQRAVGFNLVSHMFQHPFGHLALEWTGGNCIHRYVAPAQPNRQHPRQMMNGGLA